MVCKNGIIVMHNEETLLDADRSELCVHKGGI